MKLTLKNNIYKFRCKPSEDHIPRQAGFVLSSNKKHWETDSLNIAYKLKEYATRPLRLEMENRLKSYDLSNAIGSKIHIPVPDSLDYLPYQKAGIEYALRRPSTLIADEMGLGKTIQAIGYINARQAVLDKILIICPASLKINWFRETEKWLVSDHKVGILPGDEHKDLDIVIVNYAMLRNYKFLDVEWDLVILDEAHKIKNENSQRTKYVFCLKSKYKLFLTGTPILNRPIELWTLLSCLDSKNWSNRKAYSRIFCDGHYDGYGWVEKGATNTHLLNKLLRETVMSRHLKKDVLKQLPPKRHQVIEIPSNKLDDKLDKELGIFKEYQKALDKLEAVENGKGVDTDTYRRKIKKLRNDANVLFDELAEIRQGTAIAKLPFMIEYIEEMLNSIDKIVVFGYHRHILETLHERFEQSVLMYGGMKESDKQHAIDSFQNDKKCRLFVGSIEVAVGYTLTASSNIIFVEWDWVPSNMKQAADRCHRIGQHFPVLIKYLVLENSIDVIMAKQLVKKQETIDKILDYKEDKK